MVLGAFREIEKSIVDSPLSIVDRTLIKKPAACGNSPLRETGFQRYSKLKSIIVNLKSKIKKSIVHGSEVDIFKGAVLFEDSLIKEFAKA